MLASSVETRDISLAGRIMANFPEYLTADQQIGDALTELGKLATTPEANIIKLPNISASVPQLKAAIAELQSQGYKLPDYPAEAQDRRRKGDQGALRQDQGQRRQSRPPRRQLRSPCAQGGQGIRPKNNPHSMGKWSADSKTNVGTMGKDDFFSNEQSVTVPEATTVRIELVSAGRRPSQSSRKDCPQSR